MADTAADNLKALYDADCKRGLSKKESVEE